MILNEETIKGVIEKKDCVEGIDKNNKPFKRWVFVVNGKNYSTFEADIGEKYKITDRIVMHGEQKGQYWNMRSMEYDDGTQEEQLNVVTEKVSNGSIAALSMDIKAVLAKYGY